MDVVDAATGKSLLTGPAIVDVSDDGCPGSDVLGFCYTTQPLSPATVTLAVGHVYYVVSKETAGADATLEMYDPAAATTHVHRDGTTYMSYAGPGKGRVTGRVFNLDAKPGWTVISEVDTSFGPCNFIM
jgi:hypothetical protein